MSTHTYGSPPLDLRPLLRRHGAGWESMRGDAAWPDHDGWRAFHEADRLAGLHAPLKRQAADGRRRCALDLPMPAVSLFELVPVGPAEIHPG